MFVNINIIKIDKLNNFINIEKINWLTDIQV